MIASLSSVGTWAIYLLYIAFAPLLLAGYLRKGKAILQGRQGPHLLQPFRDMAKLLKKRQTVSAETGWTFRWAPFVGLAAVVAAALMAPWIGTSAPVAGDAILLIYVLALGKFVAGLGALDAGSSFGAFAASREISVSLQAEPAMILALGALSVRAHTTSLAAILTPTFMSVHTTVLAAIIVFTLWIAWMADLSRMPVDDPATHLELTMIHEALILENSGPSLAIVEYTGGLKLALGLGLLAQVALLAAPVLTPVGRYVSTTAAMIVGATVLIIAESVLVKLRWRRIPNLLSFGVAASVMACLLVAVRG